MNQLSTRYQVDSLTIYQIVSCFQNAIIVLYISKKMEYSKDKKELQRNPEHY